MAGPEGGGSLLGALLVEIENGDLRAVLGEQTGGREPDPTRARRAGNDGCLAFK